MVQKTVIRVSQCLVKQIQHGQNIENKIQKEQISTMIMILFVNEKELLGYNQNVVYQKISKYSDAGIFKALKFWYGSSEKRNQNR